MSKLERPKCTIDEATGRRIYAGSLSQTTELTEGQKRSALKMMKGVARMPSELVAELELNPLNPYSGESVRRYLAELETGGHIEQIKNERGKLLGWQQKPDK
jgi:hypothetical protein